MRLYVANTDYDWYQHLSGLAVQSTVDEVNFWRPSGKQVVKYLQFGDPFVFKLKAEHGHAIVGFGFFVAFRRLSVLEAWSTFGVLNGAATHREVRDRVAFYAHGNANAPLVPGHAIGCELIAAPVFFPREMWVAAPEDWSGQTVSGKGYDPTEGIGRRIWQDCSDRAGLLGQALNFDTPAPRSVRQPGGQPTLFGVDAAERYGTPQTVRPRLGQGTFRYALEQAYGRCAVTGEHSLPALDAAHIVPFGEDSAGHTLENGLLLRADVHRLFDRGYVTVTPDYEFRVSRRLREDYDNGKVYYQHDGQTIWTPGAPYPKPDPERLERHSVERFLDA